MTDARKTPQKKPPKKEVIQAGPPPLKTDFSETGSFDTEITDDSKAPLMARITQLADEANSHQIDDAQLAEIEAQIQYHLSDYTSEQENSSQDLKLADVPQNNSTKPPNPDDEFVEIKQLISRYVTQEIQDQAPEIISKILPDALKNSKPRSD